MISMLADTSAGSGGGATLWILIVLLVLLIGAYVFSYFKRKKYNQETSAMLSSLKPGDRVKTYSGFYGTIVSIRETTDGKVVTLETGDEDHKSYTTIDSNAIYCIDKKEDIVYDMDGNIVEPEEPQAEVTESSENAETKSVEEASADLAESVNTATETEAKTEETESSDANVIVEEAPEDKKPRKKRTSTKKK